METRKWDFSLVIGNTLEERFDDLVRFLYVVV